MANIGHRIIAVPEREQYVDGLLADTGLPADAVLWDHEHNGCMWNAIRAWSSYKDDPAATHWCVMADDTDVVNNFMTLEQMCVERFPDAIWTFYGQMSAKNRPARTPYIQLSSCNVRGIAFLMPVRLVDGYVDLCKKMLAEYGYKRDDGCARIYAFMNNIPVMTTIPSLVRSHEIESSIKGHHITRNTDVWFGKDIGIAQFMTDNYEVRHIAHKSVVDCFLKDDNPVNIAVKDKWKRYNILRRM